MLNMFESRVITKVSGMLKASESAILEKVDYTDQNSELRVKTLRSDFMGEVKNLKSTTKERDVLFIQEVKKVKEDVNSQIHELREDMKKEILSVQHDYAPLHQKVDIICDAVTRFVKLYEGVQGGERKLAEEGAKVVGKVFSSNIPSTKPVIVSAELVTSIIITTLPITRTISKGIVIGKPLESGGSGSKPKEVEAEVEIEKLRIVQSIMTQRDNDPKGMDKGDPAKHHNYETIEANVAFNHIWISL
ncbi:unnamed protein product [Lactuca saligna]|uniref:Uncharacterized protein n=1 Tax=Lactuca saligna TaxID=75948 RepID=A0AA35ZLW7_LACSI|nr:unnamed protein product [Lactuca saligna]